LDDGYEGAHGISAGFFPRRTKRFFPGSLAGVLRHSPAKIAWLQRKKHNVVASQ